MSGLLCVLFAICGATTPAGDRLPTYAETEPYARPLVAQWEGTGPTFACDQSPSGICVRAYLDTIAEPDVPTICYGETNTRMGEVRTIEECEAGLSRRLRDPYWLQYRSRVTAQTMTPQTDAAMTSLTWNIGWGAIWRSTALRRLNAGDAAGACEALTWWNRAGGRAVRGLTNRRTAEYALCMEGL